MWGCEIVSQVQSEESERKKRAALRTDTGALHLNDKELDFSAWKSAKKSTNSPSPTSQDKAISATENRCAAARIWRADGCCIPSPTSAAQQLTFSLVKRPEKATSPLTPNLASTCESGRVRAKVHDRSISLFRGVLAMGAILWTIIMAIRHQQNHECRWTTTPMDLSVPSFLFKEAHEG
ncbi:hypothetical protein AC579_6994 [Pseudocercospora musae]|uniref:Uncharacterized protein n=1 Tax=Pseudocercospora musae TaxID=113226 RepID=A0A139I9H9_9PEZI|nr:hypothetical protein AC579_6994 [Pseudocercospora musae]